MGGGCWQINDSVIREGEEISDAENGKLGDQAQDRLVQIPEGINNWRRALLMSTEEDWARGAVRQLKCRVCPNSLFKICAIGLVPLNAFLTGVRILLLDNFRKRLPNVFTCLLEALYSLHKRLVLPLRHLALLLSLLWQCFYALAWWLFAMPRKGVPASERVSTATTIPHLRR